MTKRDYGNTENDCLKSFDAQVWAKAFVEIARQHPQLAVDEGTMIGWFANALMRGYDECRRRREGAAAPRETDARAAAVGRDDDQEKPEQPEGEALRHGLSAKWRDEADRADEANNGWSTRGHVLRECADALDAWE